MGTFSFKRLLRLGQQGDDVRQLQSMLNSLGFEAGSEDGIFGQKTRRAVINFQRDAELSADGIAGNNTFDALENYMAEADDYDFTEDPDFEDDEYEENDDAWSDEDDEYTGDDEYEDDEDGDEYEDDDDDEEYDDEEGDDEYDEWEIGDRDLEEGDEGNDVLQLQEALATLGYDLSESDGVFGSETLEALLSFQSDQDLDESGVLDEDTLEALQSALEDDEDDDEDE